MTQRWIHISLRRLLFLIVLMLSAVGGTISATAAPDASPVVETPGDFQPAADGTATTAPAPTATATFASNELSINGSQAVAVTILSTDRIVFNSGSGWVGFYGDAGCTNLLGSAKSPQDEAASFFITAYGSGFWVAGVTESNVPTTTCRQVSIVNPTPTSAPTSTPTPPASMTINGKTGDVFVDAIGYVYFVVPVQPGMSYRLYYFLDDECLSYVTSTAFPENGQFVITGLSLEDTVAGNSLSVYAQREPDGARTPCQWINIAEKGEEQNTPTPNPTTTPPPPQLTATTVPTEPAPDIVVTDQPTAPVTSSVTSLPRTGAGAASPALPFGALMAGALTAIALLVAGSSKRRHRR